METINEIAKLRNEWTECGKPPQACGILKSYCEAISREKWNEMKG